MAEKENEWVNKKFETLLNSSNNEDLLVLLWLVGFWFTNSPEDRKELTTIWSKRLNDLSLWKKSISQERRDLLLRLQGKIKYLSTIEKDS